MRKCGAALLLGFVVAALGFGTASGQSTAVPAAEEGAIRAKLAEQVAAWNRGDIPAFMTVYEDSPETTFIGTDLRRGFAPILERYKKSYATREQMGTLTFNELTVRLLTPISGTTEYAVVTGRFHLERTTKGTAKKDDGIFSLVWHKGVSGWKILLDHTS